MGNPRIAPQQPPAEVDRSPHPENGILRLIPGDIIGGRPELPPAREGQSTPQVVVVDVPDLGPVRITYQLASYSHGKSKTWHWRPERADAATA